MTPLDAFWLWLLGVFCWLLAKVSDDVQTFAPAVHRPPLPSPVVALRRDTRWAELEQLRKAKPQLYLALHGALLSRRTYWVDA